VEVEKTSERFAGAIPGAEFLLSTFKILALVF
jgi:hypothetical protein